MSTIKPEPETQAQIDQEPWSSVATIRRCGCQYSRGGRWWLCDYHKGYNDALMTRARVQT